jgi:hypothetical protein
MTAELLPEPDLVKAGVILDSIPKAFSRPRLITVLIKLESATREPLDTLRKYFDEAFAKLEPGSKTPLKDALRKMRERGKKPVDAPVDAPVVTPPIEATPEPVVPPVDAPVVTPPIEATPEPVVPPVDAPVDAPVVTPPIEATLEPEGQKEFDDAFGQSGSPATEPVVAPPIESTPEPVVTPLVEPPVPERKLSNIERIKGELKKDGLVNLRGGTRKKKLRTRRRDKQNVGRSRGRKNRSNRTHSNAR